MRDVQGKGGIQLPSGSSSDEEDDIVGRLLKRPLSVPSALPEAPPPAVSAQAVQLATAPLPSAGAPGGLLCSATDDSTFGRLTNLGSRSFLLIQPAGSSFLLLLLLLLLSALLPTSRFLHDNSVLRLNCLCQSRSSHKRSIPVTCLDMVLSACLEH